MKKPLTRELNLQKINKAIDVENRTIEIAFASETPVKRDFGEGLGVLNEILKCTPDAVNLSRLLNGAPLLIEHDFTRQVGVVLDARVDSDHVCRATVKLSSIQAAETIFTSLKYFKHYTLLECKPVTGRMHQIRIHLATQKASITGDDLYGGKPVFLSKIKRGYYLGKDQEELPVMKRFALHAQQVILKGTDGEELKFTAPYPKDFATLLKHLERFDA